MTAAEVGSETIAAEPRAITKAREMVAEFDAWKGNPAEGIELLGKAISRLDSVIRDYELGKLQSGDGAW